MEGEVRIPVRDLEKRRNLWRFSQVKRLQFSESNPVPLPIPVSAILSPAHEPKPTLTAQLPRPCNRFQYTLIQQTTHRNTNNHIQRQIIHQRAYNREHALHECVENPLKLGERKLSPRITEMNFNDSMRCSASNCLRLAADLSLARE